MNNDDWANELFEFIQNEIIIYQKEIDKLKDIIENTNLCICCYDKKALYAALPCGHLIFCQDCYIKFNKKKCPICSDNILKFNKIYLSNY
jgi:hypothetical protein